MLEARDHLLDPGQRDMQVGKGGAHASVALVLDQTQGAGLGHREVHAGQTGGHPLETLTHDPTRRIGQRLDVLALGDPGKEAAKQRGDLLAVLVDGGRDDVRGALAGMLDDELAQIGLDRLDPPHLQERIEADLLRDHRLPLEQGARTGGLQQLQYDPIGFIAILGPVDLDPVGAAVALEFLQ